MKRIATILMGGLCFTFGAGGCTTQFGKPTNITLEQALTSVGTGLAGMRAAQRGEVGSGGLIPSQVTVTFNVGANATDNGSLSIQASAPTGSPVTAGGSATAGATETQSRSNQVSVTLTNILFAPPNIMADSPDTLEKLLATLKNHGYELYVVDDKKIPTSVKSHLDTLIKASQAQLQKSIDAQK